MKKIITVTLLCVAWSMQGMQNNIPRPFELQIARQMRLAPSDEGLTNKEIKFEEKCDAIFLKKNLNTFGLMEDAELNTSYFKGHHENRYKMLVNHCDYNNLLKILNHVFTEHDQKEKLFELQQIKDKSLNVKKLFEDNSKDFLKNHPNLYVYPSNYKDKADFLCGMTALPIVVYGLYKIPNAKNYRDALIKVFSKFGPKCLIFSTIFGVGASTVKYCYQKKEENNLVKKDLQMFDKTRIKASFINWKASAEITKIDSKSNFKEKLNRKQNYGTYCDLFVKIKFI
ncbi:hypothetical protein KAH94_03315 [bacterium]|nr:hypothetical protein [bacterium]